VAAARGRLPQLSQAAACERLGLVAAARKFEQRPMVVDRLFALELRTYTAAVPRTMCGTSAEAKTRITAIGLLSTSIMSATPSRIHPSSV
jgi:hypothetical protein